MGVIMKALRVIVIGTILATCFGCAAGGPTNMRERMLASAAANYSLFPDGENVVLTKFAYIGDVTTSTGLLRVVALRAAIRNMLSPRGQGAILLFNEQGNYVGRRASHYPAEPMRCEGSLVYLWGETTVSGQKGNAWNFSDGLGSGYLVTVPPFGSADDVTDLASSAMEAFLAAPAAETWDEMREICQTYPHSDGSIVASWFMEVEGHFAKIHFPNSMALTDTTPDEKIAQEERLLAELLARPPDVDRPMLLRFLTAMGQQHFDEIHAIAAAEALRALPSATD